MLTPFEILEIDDTASDAQIKKAYLAKVKQYPPERSPDRFQQIRDAYEAIKDEKQRLSHQLFNHDKPDFAQLLAQTLKSDAIQRPDEETFRKALAASLTHS